METWTIVLSVLSFLLALISVVTVIITIRQNNKMIEQSTRPVISIYTSQINVGSPSLYLIVKNFGSSPAVIRTISCDHDFADFLMGSNSLNHEELVNYDPIKVLPGTIMAPGQSKICGLNYRNLPSELVIDIVYEGTTGKHYKDCFKFDPKAGNGMIIGKSAGDNKDSLKDIKNISYTMQEMLQKNL